MATDPGPPTALIPAVDLPKVSTAHISPESLPETGPDPAPRKRGFRARYAVVYDVDGPRVRLGIGWGLLVAGALAYGPARRAGLAALFGGTAGWAAFQALTAWRPERPAADRWVAASGAAALPLASAAFGVRGLGAALLAFAVLSVVAASLQGRSWRGAAAIAGRVMSCGAWVGLASAAVVVTLRYEIGAVITLLVLVAVYEASDYLIGSGASNRIEGPLAGIISIAVVSAVVAELHVPPFQGVDAFAFGGLAAVACPLGQLFGSAILPSPAAHAPALRRLDSLLVLAPLWAWLIGLLMVHQT